HINESRRKCVNFMRMFARRLLAPFQQARENDEDDWPENQKEYCELPGYRQGKADIHGDLQHRRAVDHDDIERLADHARIVRNQIVEMPDLLVDEESPARAEQRADEANPDISS